VRRLDCIVQHVPQVLDVVEGSAGMSSDLSEERMVLKSWKPVKGTGTLTGSCITYLAEGGHRA